ncbi:prion-like-(Q/N-rich) domain-bearing protein 25 [Belonocnema kinseyi]|uniref:prion-like-(Q/N-rich) domain-bearing protein 25 n=1 Tax=Belonocnema kinseyi TaxID=2817044 RepID=UPI00143D8B2B|nr:prion-like-(Q/N-rich) domain-bearing protein 25 [Belonocnema kinseyi]
MCCDKGFNIDWKCTSDDDCTASRSRCIEKNCNCETGYVFNSGFTACLKVVSYYGELCEDTVQCSAFLSAGGSCQIDKNNKNVKNATCICGERYHYLHGKCYASSGLGEKCRTDDDCYVNFDFEASACKNGICACSDGFYGREYRTCRRAAKAVGEECTVDIDCIFNDKARCPKFICQSGEESHYLLHEFKNADLKVQNSRLEDECEKDTDCKNENMICGPELKCICKRAQFNSDGKCIAELGEPCSEDDPMLELSICRKGILGCKTGKVASLNNRKCLKVTRAYNSSCQQNEQCYVFGPDAICNEKRCLCNNNSHYEETELFCWINKGIGDSCQSDKDCHIRELEFNLSCKDSICTCPDGTLSNSEKTSCVKIPTGINAICDKSEDCVINNGDCVSKICKCKENYVALTEDNCVEASSYGNKCEHDVQCNFSLNNGICSPISLQEDVGQNSTSGICICAEGYFYNNANCFQKKYLGQSCENESECYLNNYIDRVNCRKGICSCGWDYKKLNATFCARSGSTAIHLPIWIGLMAAVFSLLML